MFELNRRKRTTIFPVSDHIRTDGLSLLHFFRNLKKSETNKDIGYKINGKTPEVRTISIAEGSEPELKANIVHRLYATRITYPISNIAILDFSILGEIPI